MCPCEHVLAMRHGPALVSFQTAGQAVATLIATLEATLVATFVATRHQDACLGLGLKEVDGGDIEHAFEKIFSSKQFC